MFKQVIGIPMGTNCAVFLATFFLFTYELDYLNFLLFDAFNNNNLEALKIIDLFKYTKRYLDDIFSLNNPLFEELQYNIYPQKMLNLSCENSKLPLHCLDVLVDFDTKLHLYTKTLQT